MATFTKTDVETFYAQRYRKKNITWVLDALEDRIIEGRDGKRAIPVYLTKQRIKSVDSLYLKTKRRTTYASLDEVTDVAGLRVLCLFGQDILEVHKYLVEILSEGGYNLTEFEIYNWLDVSYIKELVRVVQESFTAHKFKAAKKSSGYKSIHYVVTQTYAGDTYPIEIQLRTLLQDVWGELEHSLAYKKGNIHHHIKQSFQLLSKDLENMDSLMANLRDTRDKELRIGLFALQEEGPSPPFGYNNDWLPQVFTQAATPIGTAYQEYIKYMEMERDYLNLRGWAEEALHRYDAVEDLLDQKDRKEGKVHYWLLMEKAYVSFVLSQYDESQYDNAKKLYNEAKGGWKEWHMSYFRLGELCFINGETENALELFDKCEEVLLKQEGTTAQQICPLTYFHLKARIAKMYWLLGEQYYDAALRKMQEAEEIYNLHKEDIPTKSQIRTEQSIANNLCWYYLEKYILGKEKHKHSKDAKDLETAEQDYEQALKRYRNLETLMSKEDKRANDYDTAAWFCYHRFLRDNDRSFLEQARKYCRDGWGLKIYAPNIIHSSYLYRRHTQDILTAYERLG